MSLEVIAKLKTCPKIKSISITDGGKLLLKWTKVEGAEKYSIKRAASDEGEFEHIAWSKKPEFTDEDISRDVTYRYKVMAYKKLEGEKTSTKLSAVKAAVVSDIVAPEKLVAGSVKGPAIRLKWEKCKAADEYIINRRNDFYSQILPIARTKENEYTDEKIVSGQPYHYSVQPVIKDGDEEKQGNFSNEVHCVSIDKGSIIEAKALVGKRVLLKLRMVAGADCYSIERSESKDEGWQEVYRTQDALEYRIFDRVPKAFKNYYYRARAIKTVCKEEFKGNYCDVYAVKSK